MAVEIAGQTGRHRPGPGMTVVDPPEALIEGLAQDAGIAIRQPDLKQPERIHRKGHRRITESGINQLIMAHAFFLTVTDRFASDPRRLHE